MLYKYFRYSVRNKIIYAKSDHEPIKNVFIIIIQLKNTFGSNYSHSCSLGVFRFHRFRTLRIQPIVIKFYNCIPFLIIDVKEDTIFIPMKAKTVGILYNGTIHLDFQTSYKTHIHYLKIIFLALHFNLVGVIEIKCITCLLWYYVFDSIKVDNVPLLSLLSIIAIKIWYSSVIGRWLMSLEGQILHVVGPFLNLPLNKFPNLFKISLNIVLHKFFLNIINPWWSSWTNWRF